VAVLRFVRARERGCKKEDAEHEAAANAMSHGPQPRSPRMPCSGPARGKRLRAREALIPGPDCGERRPGSFSAPAGMDELAVIRQFRKTGARLRRQIVLMSCREDLSSHDRAYCRKYWRHQNTMAMRKASWARRRVLYWTVSRRGGATGIGTALVT
jgi:hypothetical protein